LAAALLTRPRSFFLVPVRAREYQKRRNGAYANRRR
jgi:hypothetical protein